MCTFVCVCVCVCVSQTHNHTPIKCCMQKPQNIIQIITCAFSSFDHLGVKKYAMPSMDPGSVTLLTSNINSTR